MASYWETLVRHQRDEGEENDCRFCGQTLGSARTLRQHEEHHVSKYRCERCPGRGWTTRQRATEHAVGHTVHREYHAPQPLASQTPLLARWNNLTPMVTLRRVNIPDPTVDPEQQAAELPRGPPNSPEELSAIETEMALENIFNSEGTDEDPMSMWTSTEMSATLDDLVRIMEGPFPEETDITPPVATAATLRSQLDEARRDVHHAMEMLTHTQRRLDTIQAAAELRDYDPFLPVML